MVIVSQRFHLNFELIAVRFVLGKIFSLAEILSFNAEIESVL